MQSYHADERDSKHAVQTRRISCSVLRYPADIRAFAIIPWSEREQARGTDPKNILQRVASRTAGSLRSSDSSSLTGSSLSFHRRIRLISSTARPKFVAWYPVRRNDCGVTLTARLRLVGWLEHSLHFNMLDDQMVHKEVLSGRCHSREQHNAGAHVACATKQHAGALVITMNVTTTRHDQHAWRHCAFHNRFARCSAPLEGGPLCHEWVHPLPTATTDL